MSKRYPKPFLSVVLFDKERKVLLGRRAKGAVEEGNWSLPEIRLEGGKDWSSTLKDSMGAMGVVPKDFRLIGLYSDPKTHTYNSMDDGAEPGDKEHHLVALFMVNDFEGEPTPGMGLEVFEWFHTDSLPDPMLQADPTKINDANHFKGEVFIR